MCGGKAWAVEGWQPFAEMSRTIATAVQLRVDLFRLGLHPDVYERLKTIAGSRATSGPKSIPTPSRPMPWIRPRRTACEGGC